MRGAALLLLLAASCGSAAPQNASPAAPEGREDPAGTLAEAPPPGAVPEALALWTPSPAPGRPPKVAGTLARAVCVGPVLAADPPHKASCCYPVMAELKRPFRAAFPALRACYEARTNPAAEGTVTFDYRIEEDGSVKRACVEKGSTMDDESAARCMAEVVRTLRFPAIGKEGRDLCGLISLHYPVVFEP